MNVKGVLNKEAGWYHVYVRMEEQWKKVSMLLVEEDKVRFGGICGEKVFW